MRFLANGPEIPDELLIARDEGRVVFFCGAGVSRARAGLPDFFGLARSVTELLGVPKESSVRKIIEEARAIADRVGESGLISADRVFGLLERQFVVADIHSAVARSLTPPQGVDLTAHRLLLDLARGPDGTVRLVTTNFDLLFEACDARLTCWQPPRLPDPRRYNDLNGIVHLHGRVNATYSGSDGDGFVLSSSEFGRAYLSDAWATQFIRAILEKYLVVFVGYTADDPPVQYLLEALNRDLSSRGAVFAFQSGSHGDAAAKWIHKGVQAITYDQKDDHLALWTTLSEWALRARDVDHWYSSAIATAQAGPEALSPHQRGQIAHVVSTLDGARLFSAGVPTPPAEWLCVFDPLVRYSVPRSEHSEYLSGDPGTFVDPFSIYGLDSDLAPEKIAPNDHYKKRETPKDAWDAFALTRLDRQGLTDQNLPSIRGYLSTNVPALPARLWALAIWLQKVADQPAAVWWAGGQLGIHSDVQRQLRFILDRSDRPVPSEIRKSWRHIFESWESTNVHTHLDRFDLRATIARDGWTSATVRAFALLHRPSLETKRPYSSPRPPKITDDLKRRQLVSVDVKYTERQESIPIPDEHLLPVLREFRKNLELAVLLEQELGGFGLGDLVPIEADPSLEGSSSAREFGLAVPFLMYVDLFKRLVARDLGSATQEMLAWWHGDETIFGRLRLWACGDSGLVSGENSGKLVSELSDDLFWNVRHQRDLLLVLAKRWKDFPSALQLSIGERLLRGPHRWPDEDNAHYFERRAWTSLSRIHWLNSQGCNFIFSLEDETKKLRQFAPKWQNEYAKKTADSLESTSGWVKTEKNFAPLLSVPLSEVLAKSAELSNQREERFVQNDPFAGLALSRPVRALSALTAVARRGEYPEWAWRTFLNPETRSKDKPRLSALIAERTSRTPQEALVPLTYATSEWLLKTGPTLSEHHPPQFDHLWNALMSSLRGTKEGGRSSVLRSNMETDWGTEALNAPGGKLAELLMQDPASKNLERGRKLPPTWLKRVEELLSLAGDPRRHALVMFSYNLNWFYAIDPEWTQEKILSAIEVDSEDKEAVLAGLFWGSPSAGGVTEPLLRELKPLLLDLAQSDSLSRRGHVEALSAILLLGWGNQDSETGKSAVSDSELRSVLIDSSEEFRLHVLWQLERWSEGEEDWKKKVRKFLTDVWPRQKRIRTPKVVARLCELAFSNPSIFSEVADVVLELLAKADGEHLLLHDLADEDGVVQQHPRQTLALLHAVLPADTSRWPYRINEVLDRIAAADAALPNDTRLIELRRCWNAR